MSVMYSLESGQLEPLTFELKLDYDNYTLVFQD